MQDTQTGEMIGLESLVQLARDEAIPDRKRQGVILSVGEEVEIKDRERAEPRFTIGEIEAYLKRAGQGERQRTKELVARLSYQRTAPQR